ncbi:MAG: PAS domain S-box protein [Deltaproteobacteria bacterium]|nr:PAS domain S-box protein [Deltaproteobacteria bacterium]
MSDKQLHPKIRSDEKREAKHLDEPRVPPLEQNPGEISDPSQILSLTAEIGKALVRGKNLEKTLQSCTEVVVSVLDVDFARIWTMEHDQNLLKLRASAGLHTRINGKYSQVPVGKFSVGKIAADKKPIISNNATEASIFQTNEWAIEHELVAFMGQPLVANDKIVGVMALFSKKRFSEITVKLINAVTDQIALGIVREQTRKAALRALRDSERRFRTSFEHAPIPMYLSDLRGNFLMVNQTMCEKFGYLPDELRTKQLQDIVLLDDLETILNHIQLLIDGETRVVSFEKRYQRKNGQMLWAGTNISLIRTPDGDPLYFIGHIQDITHRKNLETQLLQAQKMKAIGTLAGGIAHDFNNLLMAIQGRVSLMQLSADENNPMTEHLSAMESHIHSAANLTRQLLGFARGGKYELKPVDMNQLIMEQTRLFGRTRKEVTIHCELESDIWTVRVDAEQIKHSLLNIFINAWQAMPKGGDMFVRTENIVVTDAHRYPFEVLPGEYVKTSVKDTGVGMNEATRYRVFEPFFTTRQLGQGTGLGLASTYGIVKHHAGFITVNSKPGKGTTFHIFLPATDNSVKRDRKTASPIAKGEETVLLIDDEPMIVDIGSQMLKQMGYHALTALSGAKGLKIYEEYRRQVNLVILDMVMPKMSGEDTFRAIREIDPNAKVILSSGYDLDSKASELLNSGCLGFIQKPFNLSQLSAKIREVLDQTR